MTPKERLLVAIQTGKAGAAKGRLNAYDAFYTSSVAHYGKVVFTLSRRRIEDAEGNQTGEFAPTMTVNIAKANLDTVGSVNLGVIGPSMRIVDMGELVEQNELEF